MVGERNSANDTSHSPQDHGGARPGGKSPRADAGSRPAEADIEAFPPSEHDASDVSRPPPAPRASRSKSEPPTPASQSQRPKATAWAVGRLLARLNWDLQLDSLSLDRRRIWPTDDPHGWETDPSIEEIAVASRGLVDHPLEKDRLESALRKVGRDFHEGRNHAIALGYVPMWDLIEANEKLLRLDQDEHDLRETHDRLCSELVYGDFALVALLRSTLAASTHDDLLGVLLLAELVNQGLYPEKTYRLTYEHPEDIDHPVIDNDHPRLGSWWLATRTPVPGERAPNREWFLRVKARWGELGISGPLPAAFRRNMGRQREQDSVEAFTSLVDQIEQAAIESFNAEIPDVSTPEPLSSELPADSEPRPTPGYLGLILDTRQMIASRDGHCGKVEMAATRLSWQLLLKLEREGETHASKTDLYVCWRNIGRQSSPSSQAVYAAIGTLRNHIACLQLDIECEYGVGYRLVSIDLDALS